MAIWNLRPDWEPDRSMSEKLGWFEAAVAAFGDPQALLELAMNRNVEPSLAGSAFFPRYPRTEHRILLQNKLDFRINGA
jgi:hypothetical protein